MAPGGGRLLCYGTWYRTAVIHRVTGRSEPQISGPALVSMATEIWVWCPRAQ